MSIKGMKKSMVFSAVIAVIGLAVYSSFLLTVKADTPNLIEDPGFENGSFVKLSIQR